MVSKNDFWIFQANPKYYNMVGALEEYLTMDFTVTRYRKEIKPEDTVLYGFLARMREFMPLPKHYPLHTCQIIHCQQILLNILVGTRIKIQ